MNPVCHIPDILAVFATVITATVAPLIVADAEPNSKLLLLLLPLLGSLIMTGAAILLNPEPETRRIVIGRSIIAVLFGVAAPQILAMFWGKFNPKVIEPVLLVIVGSIFAFVAYIGSRPFFNEAYKRSAMLARMAQDEAMRRVKLGK